MFAFQKYFYKNFINVKIIIFPLKNEEEEILLPFFVDCSIRQKSANKENLRHQVCEGSYRNFILNCLKLISQHSKKKSFPGDIIAREN